MTHHHTDHTARRSLTLALFAAVALLSGGCATVAELPSDNEAGEAGGWVQVRSFSNHMATRSAELEDLDALEPIDIDEMSCQALGRSAVTVEPTCSFGPCGQGSQVTVYTEEGVIAEGTADERLEVPVGCPFTLRVLMADLDDAPTYELQDYLVVEDRAAPILPLSIETARLSVATTYEGQPASGHRAICRYPEVAGDGLPSVCRTLTDDEAAHLSAGTYLVKARTVQYGQTQTVTEVVTVEAGQQVEVTFAMGHQAEPVSTISR